MVVELISETKSIGDRFGKSSLTGEELIVAIARESTDKSLEERTVGYEKLIKYLITNSHWSPFEMVDITFYIETSIAISKQLLRHRSFSFQELSRRYSSSMIELERVDIREKGSNNRQGSIDSGGMFESNHNELTTRVKEVAYRCLELYQDMLDNGVAPECARMVLPQSTQTRMYMKGSLRSWLTFLNQRDNSHAQKEIRMIATEVKLILSEMYPTVFRVYNNLILENGRI